MEFIGLNQLNSSFIILENSDAAYDEIVEIKSGTQKKLGKVVTIEKDKTIIQVFGNNNNLSLNNTRIKFTGRPMEIKLSEEILGRTFNGIGEPIDGLGEIYEECRRNINGSPINPVSRVYPQNYIQTGISAIDGLTTLIRGQKLPVFSGNGLPHDKLAAQIVRQASLKDKTNQKFAIVFAAMGIKHDTADYFKKLFNKVVRLNVS